MIITQKFAVPGCANDSENTPVSGVFTAIPGHRFYSPSLGRFINKDPIEEAGGLNLYSFCGNDGVNKWDYLGQAEGEGWQYQSTQDVNGNWTVSIDWGGAPTGWDIIEAGNRSAANVNYITYAEGAIANQLANVSAAAYRTLANAVANGNAFMAQTSKGNDVVVTLGADVASAWQWVAGDLSAASGMNVIEASTTFAAGYAPNNTAGVHAGYSDGIPDDYDIRRLGSPDSNIRIAPDGLIINRGRPIDSVVFTAFDGQKFLAPAGTDFNAVYKAGVANGTGKIAMYNAVAHWGTFDFQRNGGAGKLTGNNIFFTQYTSASNYAVGVYLNGAGYSLHDALDLAGWFANRLSSNAGAPAQATWQTQGWWAGQHGAPNGKGGG